MGKQPTIIAGPLGPGEYFESGFRHRLDDSQTCNLCRALPGQRVSVYRPSMTSTHAIHLRASYGPRFHELVEVVLDEHEMAFVVRRDDAFDGTVAPLILAFL